MSKIFCTSEVFKCLEDLIQNRNEVLGLLIGEVCLHFHYLGHKNVIFSDITETWRRGKNFASSSTLHSYVVLINCKVNSLISIGFSDINNFDYQSFQYSFRGKSTRGWGVLFFRQRPN